MEKDRRHFNTLDIKEGDFFLIFFIYGILYLIVSAFIFFKAISICRHKKKKLQTFYIIFYASFILTVLVRGIGFILYIFNLDFKTNKTADPPRIPYIAINFFLNMPFIFENIATVIFICLLQYILQLWDISRRNAFRMHLKRLIYFLSFQFLGGILLFFICAYTSAPNQIFFSFYLLVDIVVIFIVYWRGLPFILFLKHYWRHIFDSVKIRLRFLLFMGSVGLLSRAIVFIVVICGSIDHFTKSSYYPIYVFFYIFIVEVFPILCFGGFLSIQKEKIKGATHPEPLQNENVKWLLEELDTGAATYPLEKLRGKGNEGPERIKSESAPSRPTAHEEFRHTFHNPESNVENQIMSTEEYYLMKRRKRSIQLDTRKSSKY